MIKQILLVLCLIGLVYSAPTFIQSRDTTNDGESSAMSVRLNTPATLGNTLIAIVSNYYARTSHSVSDSLNNNWQLVDSVWSENAACKFSVWVATNCKAGITRLDATYGSGSANYRRIAIMEYSGIDSIDPIAAHLSFGGVMPSAGVDAITTNTLTPARSNSLLFATCREGNYNTNNNLSAGTNFTLRFKTSADYHMIAEDRVYSGIDPVAATVTVGTTQSGGLVGVYAIFNPLESYVPDPEPPVITSQPRDSTVVDGSTVSFSITATNATGYQWYGNGSLISGATNSVYSFTATLALSGSSIYCRVTNATDTVWSDTAVLTVNVVSGNTKLTIGNSFKPRYSAEEILISNFDGGVGTEWVKTAGLSVVDDTINVRNGTKSIIATTEYATTTSAAIKKSFSSTSFDTIDYFVLTIHIDDIVKVKSDVGNSLALTFSTALNDYFYKEYNLSTLSCFDSGWYKIPFHKGSLVKIGNGDWNNILSITLIVKNNVNVTREITFDQLTAIKSPVKGGIVFWFDAISSGIYEYARPIFDRYNMKFTTSVKAKVVGESGNLTLNQLKQLQNEGHDLVSYPWDATALTSLTALGVDTQLTKIKTYMVDNGFPNWKFLAFSQTSHNRLVDSIAFSKGFEWFRGNQIYNVGGTSILQTPPYSNRCFGQYVYLTQDIGTLTGIVDTAIKYNTVIPMLFHGVRTYDSSSMIDTTKLVALLDYCETKLGSGELGYAGKVTNYILNTAPAEITVQPVSDTVTAGQAATFFVTASGSGLVYQWYRNDSLIAGATNDTFTYTARSQVGNYTDNIYCLLTTDTTISTDTVQLLVNGFAISPTFIQKHDTTNDNYVSTLSLKYDSPNTAGNCLIAVVEGYWVGSGHSVSDSLNNTWELVDSVWYSTATCKVSVWVAKNCKAGATKVTATYSPNQQRYVRMAILEYSGIDTTTPIAAHKTFYGSMPSAGTDALASGDLTPSYDGSLLFATFQEANYASNTNASQGTGFNLRVKTSADYHLLVEDKINSGTSPVQATFTLGTTQTGSYVGIYAILNPLITDPDSTITIIQQPNSDTVTSGQLARFFVTAEGLGLTYQWYRNDSLLSGENNDTLEYTTRSNEAYFDTLYCLLTTNTTISSDTVYLSVEETLIDSGVFILNPLLNNRVYQRLLPNGNPGGTQCSITVSGVNKANTGYVKALVRNKNTGDTIVNWITLATNPDSGNFSYKLSVPQGGWYTLSVCNDRTDTIVDTNRFGVGDIWLVAGQSLIMGWNSAHSAIRDTANDLAVNFSQLTWKRLIDPILTGHGASPFIKMANSLVTNTGVPHAFINTAVGGTTISNWLDRSLPLSDTSKRYNRSITYAQLSGGKIRGLIWGQGESDAVSGTTKENYKSRFDTLMTRYRYDLGYDTLPIFYQQCGKLGVGVATTEHLNTIREAQAELENHSKRYYLITPMWDLDFLTSDSTHLSQAGNDTLGVRWGKQLSKWFFGNLDSCPRISSVTAYGNVVTINTTANELKSATSLNNIVIFDTNGDTLVTSNISIVGNTIYNNLTSDITTDSISVSYASKSWPVVLQELKDTSGIPVLQLLTPLKTKAMKVYDTIVLTCSAENVDNYQWYLNNTIIVGATDSVITILADSLYYNTKHVIYCLLSNSEGSVKSNFWIIGNINNIDIIHRSKNFIKGILRGIF